MEYPQSTITDLYQDEPSTPTALKPSDGQQQRLRADSAYHDVPYHDASPPPVPTSTKPLPPLPYRDSNRAPPSPQPVLPSYQDDAQAASSTFAPYTDDEDENTPLGLLVPAEVADDLPDDAPPSYIVAVQQSYRDTLIAHIPSDSIAFNTTHAAMMGIRPDEERELGILEMEMEESHSHLVEKMVAHLIIGVVLLIVGTGLLWWVLNDGKVPFAD